MPTVRADIKPLGVFPSPRGNSDVQTLSIFPAEGWEKWGGEPGLFRVMVGDAWVCRQHERRSFFDEQGLRDVAWRWFAGALGLPDGAPQPGTVLPDCPPLSYVWLNVPGEMPLATRTRARAFRDAAGDWRVLVYQRANPVPLDYLTLRERGDGI